MAKNKSCGPGMTERGGVRTTMSNPNNVSTSGPSSGMGAPFSKAHDVGNGGIPVNMYDRTLKPGALPAPSQPAPGRSGGQQRPGSK